MKKPKIKQTVDSFEQARDLFKDTGKEISKELVQKGVTALWEEILGGTQKSEAGSKSGDLKPGEEISLKEEKKVQTIEPGINYVREIVHAEKRISAENEQKDRTRVQEILIEIKTLINTSKELKVQFKDVSMVEQIPQGAGKYHSNFVEWVLSMIRSAKERVDTALTWTNAMKSKRGQKTYWALYKKHGAINFGLSSERVVATQVG